MPTPLHRSGLTARVVVVAGLVGYLAAVYTVVVIGGGLLAPAAPGAELALTFVAAALVALTLEPVRERLRRWQPTSAEDRLLRLTTRSDDSGDLGVWLEQLARLISEALGGGATVVVTASLGGELSASWQWPRTPLPNAQPPDLRRAIVREDRELGELTVSWPAGRVLTPVEQRLLDDAVDQAGLVIEAARMDLTLQQIVQAADSRRLDLQQSRRRILDAMEEERRRVERNIHDGAQQHLVALAVSLRLLRVLLERDPARAQAKAKDLVGAVHNALDTLRRLAEGLYPPALVEAGPVSALRLAAESSPVPVILQTQVSHRWSASIEQAVYFSCLEALQNAIKHAEARRILVTVVDEPGQLRFEVSDDGRGYQADLVRVGSGSANLGDRLSAVGGWWTVTSTPGSGTTVTGGIPTAAPVRPDMTEGGT